MLRLLPLLLLAGCSTLPPYEIQEVDTSQREPKQISQVLVKSTKDTKALCGDVCACNVPYGDRMVIITTENFYCLLHEVEHSIFGPNHLPRYRSDSP